MMRRAASCALALGALVLVAQGSIAADSDGDGLRDGFEERSGVTDPLQRDSDGDGIIDAAEDPDGDRLSNLGEQRFKSHPGRRDSDGDGIPDGAEDADRDGRSNARQQDRRPIPRGLSPKLAKAPTAWPPARVRCQTAHGESRIHPCAFGQRESETTIVLFGDSHATQWLPALTAAGEREGWRIRLITKTGCPAVDILPTEQRSLDGGRTCQAWRDRAIEWIRAHGPEVVILSNLRYATSSGAIWRAGLLRTLRAFPQRTRAVVLADTPRLRVDPAPCLASHRTNIAACVTARGLALQQVDDPAERSATQAAGAAYIDLSRKVCPYDPCPLVIGRTLLWRDHAHLTAAFSRELWPSMRHALRAALGDGLAAGEPS